MSEYAVVGKRVPREDAMEKVTGDAKYTDDVNLPGMLYGKFLYSPYAHAEIKRIDASKARRLPGVKAVLTYQDLASAQSLAISDSAHGTKVASDLFASDKARYEGDRIAVVAATDPDLAEDATGLIEVEYEVLPAVFDVMAAIKPGAPLVHEEAEPVTAPDGRVLYNISGEAHISHGDVARAFREADVVVEGTYTVPRVHQTYMEPNVVIADVDVAGKVTVWTTTQGIFDIRSGISNSLGIPLSKVNVIGMTMGGAFGAKFGMALHPCTVLLAMETGRPVKMVMTRHDEFLDGRPAPGCVVSLKTAAKRDGTITARQATAFWDGGASGGGAGNGARLWSIYRIPNVQYDGYGVYTNKPGPSAYRAPSSPQATFTSEAQLDQLAEALNLDPVELRLRNLVEEGDVLADGREVPLVGFKETLQRVADHVGWKDRRKEPGLGWGVAVGEWTNGSGPCGTIVSVHEDGSVHLFYGMMDITGSNTSMAQIVAEVLGVPYEAVRVRRGDTDSAPYSMGSGGSSIAFSMGNAVRAAAEDAKRRILELATEALGATPQEMMLRDGQVTVKDAPDLSVTLAELAHAGMRAFGGPIVGRGGSTGRPSAPVISAQIAQMEVDRETGKMRLLRFAAAQDAGRAINPISVEGQMEGGAVQGLSWGWMEEMRYGGNGNLNPNFLDYKIPTAYDLPILESLIVEVPWENGPYGAKGVGEPPITPGLAVVANAVFDAIGVRLTDLPLTPEKIVSALKASH